MKPPMEGTGSHLRTPNATAPSGTCWPNLSLAPGPGSLWICLISKPILINWSTRPRALWDSPMSSAGLQLGEAELVTSAWCFSSTALSCSFLRAQSDARGALDLTGEGDNRREPRGGAGLNQNPRHRLGSQAACSLIPARALVSPKIK